MTSYFDEFIC